MITLQRRMTGNSRFFLMFVHLHINLYPKIEYIEQH